MPFVNGEFVWAGPKPEPPITTEATFKCQKDELVLSNNISSLLNLDNPKVPIDYSDFIVKVGATKFNVHFSILSARCEVFRAMFGYDYIEKKSGRIKITEFEVDVVRGVLGYIYGVIPKFTMTQESIPDILDLLMLRAADFYKLPGLVTICENLLVARLQKFNKIPDFCEMLSVAYNCQTPRLMMMMATKYCKFVDRVKELENFDQLGETLQRNLNALLKSYSAKRGLISRSFEEKSRLFELPEFAVLGSGMGLASLYEAEDHKKENIPLTTSTLDELRINERVTPDNKLVADDHFVWRIYDPHLFARRMPDYARIDICRAVTSQDIELCQYGLKLKINCFSNHLRYPYVCASDYDNHLLFGLSYEQESPPEVDVRMGLQLVDRCGDRHMKFQKSFWTYKKKHKPRQRLVFRISKEDVTEKLSTYDKSMDFRVELEIVLYKNLLFWADVEQRMHVTMMRNDMWAMYEQGIHWDFKLTVGGEDFKVHRNILNIRSGILKVANQAKTFTIPNVSSNSIHKLVEYLYTDTITAMDIGTARELLGVAFDYGIPALGSKCEVYLVSELKVGNACESIRLAQRYRAKALEEQAVVTIGKNFDRFWRTSDCKNVLSELLELCNPVTTNDESNESESSGCNSATTKDEGDDSDWDMD